ncbi:hypothetical protein Tco_0052772 [Tanacetum coccineum]
MINSRLIKLWTPEDCQRVIPFWMSLCFFTSTKPRVPDEVKGASEAKADSTINWGLEEKSEYSKEETVDEEIEWLTTYEEEEKKDDDEDDRSIDIKKTDDDKETYDEFVHGNEYVHDDVDEEMKDAEVTKTGKDGEDITDVEKTDAEKTEVTKGDLEQAGKLPLISSSLSVSSDFGNQFLNLSLNTSLNGTTKESPDTEINSLLDIQIQQEPTVLSPIPEIPLVTLARTPPPPSYVSNLTPVLQQTTTPIPTPPITTVAPAATTFLDPLPAIAQRVSVLEKDVQELKQVDQSPAIIATIRSEVPAAVDEYLGSSLEDTLQKVLQKHKELIQQSSQKDVFEIIKIKQEQAAKEPQLKFSAIPYDQVVEAEFKQKEILFKMMRESKSYRKHPKHKALYDALMLSLIQDEDDLDRMVPDLRKRDRKEDEDPSSGSNQGKKKRSSGKGSEPSKTSSASKKTSKGNTPPKSSKNGKSASAEESVKEATHEVTMGDEEPVQDNVNDVDQPNVVDDQPEQPWFNNLLSAQKDSLTFNELMTTLIDFSKFTMNRLKINKLTKSHLVGLVYNLLKGTCQSNIELEYNMEECYKALSDQLDWNNLEGDRYPFDLSKPLPLKGHPGHLTVASEYLFNNDLEYLKSSDPEKKYTMSITKTKATRYKFLKHDVFSHLKILSVKSVTVNKLHGYGYLEEIMVRRADRQLYKFKEIDFVNLHLNDIEDMLLVVVQHKLFHLDGDVIVDLVVALRMFTRSLIIKKRVEDVQLGVESYQKKLNITKRPKDFPGISAKELYTPSFDPPRIFYADLSNRK